MFGRISSASVYLLVLALSQLAAGMNLSYVANCPANDHFFSDIAYFNTTGTTNFTMQQLTGDDKPWYFHLALASQDNMVFRLLSIPKSFLESSTSNDTSPCMYSTDGKDGSLENKQGNETCSGVFSDKCMQAFDVPAGPGGDRFGCPNVDMDEFKDCHSDGIYSGCELVLSHQFKGRQQKNKIQEKLFVARRGIAASLVLIPPHSFRIG